MSIVTKEDQHYKKPQSTHADDDDEDFKDESSHLDESITAYQGVKLYEKRSLKESV